MLGLSKMATVIKFSRIKVRPGRSPAQSRQTRRGVRIPWLLVVSMAAAGLFYYATRQTEIIEVNTRFTMCEGGGSRNCVIDGDTIILGGEKIRLIGLDAPEIFSPGCSQERAFGVMAKQELLHALNSGPFKLLRYRNDDRDVYGRKLRVVERDGRSLTDSWLPKDWRLLKAPTALPGAHRLTGDKIANRCRNKHNAIRCYTDADRPSAVGTVAGRFNVSAPIDVIFRPDHTADIVPIQPLEAARRTMRDGSSLRCSSRIVSIER